MNERDIFIAALQRDDPAERAAYLDEACAHDAALRRRVELLLRMHAEASGFLDAPAAPPAQTAHHEPPGEPALAVGAHVGPYKLVQQLGEGGMGTVYLAEQEQPVKRRVALKVIKPGMDSARVLRRFQAEEQALALMDHPNIAKVFDAGLTPTGHPYFVMELVKGESITRYCDAVQLPVRDRLALFTQVCAAVQHAHQKGIIHRDIKPGNILVCMQDGRPVPKVIDFGVAKALNQKLTDQTMVTELGAVVGTLEYMSPEQAELSAMDVDTRADVYALGVLLYELLTGSTPLDRKRLGQAAYREVLRIIREEEPPRPSTRLTQSRESLANLAARRRTEPARLTREVRGELDWIVMKCLEKDRTRRYGTADGLARDVQRYLADEPVEACPPSAGYRLRKLLRRHRGLVLAAALVLLALAAGVVGTSWGLVRAEQARREAVAQRALAQANEQKALEQQRIAEAVRNFLQHDLLRQADPGAQADALRRAGGGFEATVNPTVKELLDRAAAQLTPGKVEARFPGQPVVQASILQTVGTTYWGIGAYARAVEFLTRASDTYRQAVGVDDPATLAALEDLAGAYHSAGKTAEAIALFEQVRDARLKRLGPDDPDTLTTLDDLAAAYLSAGRTAQAVALFEQVRDGRVKRFGPDDPRTLATRLRLAQAYQFAGKTAEAAALFEQVRDACVKQLGADHPQTLVTLDRMGGTYLAAGKPAEAVAHYERLRDAMAKTLGADHPQTLATLLNLAQAYRAAGKLPEAIALYGQVRDACLKKLGADHPLTLATLDNLAGAYLLAGKTAEAIALYEQVRDARVRTLGADHPHTLLTLCNLAEAYRAAGKTAEAIALFEQVRDARVKQLGPDHADTLSTLAGLALAYQAAGRTEQALPWLLQAAAGIEKRQFVHPSAGPIIGALIDSYERQKQPDQAEAWRRKWLAVVKERSGADSLAYATELALLGLNLLRRERWADAEPVLRECLAVREKAEPDAWTTFNIQSMLGAALLGQEKYTAAEPLLRKGYERMKQQAAQIPPQGKVRLVEALKRLLALAEATGHPDEAARWRKELKTVEADAKPPDQP